MPCDFMENSYQDVRKTGKLITTQSGGISPRSVIMATQKVKGLLTVLGETTAVMKDITVVDSCGQLWTAMTLCRLLSNVLIIVLLSIGCGTGIRLNPVHR